MLSSTASDLRKAGKGQPNRRAVHPFNEAGTIPTIETSEIPKQIFSQARDSFHNRPQGGMFDMSILSQEQMKQVVDRIRAGGAQRQHQTSSQLHDSNSVDAQMLQSFGYGSGPEVMTMFSRDNATNMSYNNGGYQTPYDDQVPARQSIDNESDTSANSHASHHH